MTLKNHKDIKNIINSLTFFVFLSKTSLNETIQNGDEQKQNGDESITTIPEQTRNNSI